MGFRGLAPPEFKPTGTPRLDDATVRLAWRSAAEIGGPNDPRMWLYVNGEPVAELPMGAGEEMTAEIGLPVEMLSAGSQCA